MRRIAPILLVLAACEGGGTGGGGFVVRDSVGVTIVESAMPVWVEGGAWRLAAEPDVEIGVTEGDSLYQFTRLTTARFLADGGIVAVDFGMMGLRLFRPDGTYHATLGREGEAPGEFRDVWDVQVRADTLIVSDTRLRRVTRFTVDRVLLDVVPIAMPGAEPMGSALPLPDGRFLIVPSWSSAMMRQPTPGLHREPVPLLVYGADGAQLDTLGIFSGIETEVIRAGERMTIGSPTFGRVLAVTVGGDGVWVGTGDELEIRLYSPAGALRRIQRVYGFDLSITAADVQSVRARMLERVPPENRPFLEQMFANAVIPERRAAYSFFIVDDEGNLWTSPAETTVTPFGTWNVFDAQGRWLGELAFPDTFRPFDVRGGRVLGRWRDENDVESLRVYRIHKS